MASSQHKKIMLNGVIGLAVNKDGKVLVTQRHQPKDPDVHLKWQLPGGGMEFSEQPEQTLAREMQEELGVSCRILHKRPIVKTSVWNENFADSRKGALHVTLICYLISIDNQTPTLNDPETVAWKWVSIEEASKLEMLPLTLEFLREGLTVLQK